MSWTYGKDSGVGNLASATHDLEVDEKKDDEQSPQGVVDEHGASEGVEIPDTRSLRR